MFKLSKLTVVCAIFALSTICRPSYCEELKIGYVDFEEILKRYYKTQLYNEKMQSEMEDEQKLFQVRVDEINKLKQEMELLSDDAKKEKEKLLQTKITEAQSKREQTSRDLRRKMMNIRNDVYTDIYKEIEKQGQAGNYTYILRKQFGGEVPEQFIFYADKKNEITEKVIDELNKNKKDSLKDKSDEEKPKSEEKSKEPEKSKSDSKMESFSEGKGEMKSDMIEEIQKDMPKNIKSE